MEGQTNTNTDLRTCVPCQKTFTRPSGLKQHLATAAHRVVISQREEYLQGQHFTQQSQFHGNTESNSRTDIYADHMSSSLLMDDEEVEINSPDNAENALGDGFLGLGVPDAET